MDDVIDLCPLDDPFGQIEIIPEKFWDRPAIIPGNVKLSQTQTAAERLTIVPAGEIAAEGALRLTTDFVLPEGYAMGKFD